MLALIDAGVNPGAPGKTDAGDKRLLVFLGDLTDRGEDSVSVLNLVMKIVESG